MKKFIVCIAALLCAASLGFSQELPNDPETKVGKLDNGLTYYIRHNENPAQRAEFYLATNVGAVQEEADQGGLAHFLEHMCFNGTKNYPGKGILEWLQSIGASFGGNVNASTGIEQTTYLLTNIPLVRPTVVDSCLLILHDYSHFVLCEPSEIDAERGVILEEKRTRNTSSWRSSENLYATLFKGSKYETVLPELIGSEEQLKTFKPESLVNYYHTWYYPGNQAVIVVGDIDVNEVEAKIKSTFADIQAPENPAQKVLFKVPDNKEPIVSIFTDPEITSSSISTFWKSEAQDEAINSTATGLMLDILKDLIGTVMDERFADIASKPDAPFLGASFNVGNVVESTDAVEADVQEADEKILSAFEAMLIEVEKMHRYGFSDAEIDRAKTEILSQYETRANRASTRRNSEFVNPMLNNFYDNKSFMDPAQEYQIVQMLMPQLPAAAINQVAQALITEDNMVVVYNGPKKDGLVNPTEQQILDIIAKVRSMEIERGAVEEIPTEFLNPAKLKGSKVKKSASYIYDSEILTLANGMQVILRPSDLEKDRINISLAKKGGRSLIATEDLPSFEDNIWSLYLSCTGVAEFPNTTVSKMLAGKQLSVTPFINGYTHGINAFATPKDLETALQILYLYFTNPRFDADEYSVGMNQIAAVLPNLEQQANYKLQDQLYKTIYEGDRRQMISQELVSKASLQTLEKVYRSLFDGVNGAVAIIAGDFSKEEILPLVQKYLGSLPKSKKASAWKYMGDGFKSGKVINEFRDKMETPKVTVVQVYNTMKPFSYESDAAYTAVSYILDMVYTNTLREEEGGTYGASTAAQVSDDPYENVLLQVAFETNDQQADKLRELAIKGLKDMAENGPAANMFDKAVANAKKNIPESKLRNAYWMNALQTYAFHGRESVDAYQAAVDSLTPEKVKAAAAELLNSGNFIELVQRPQL